MSANNVALLGPGLTVDKADAARQQVMGPCSIWVEGGLGGGTVTIKVSRTLTSTQVTLTTATTAGVINDAIIGPHFVEAELSGATGATLAVYVG